MDKRIYSIDFIRGLVMIIMALDHVRDLMHISALTENPTDLATTTPILFFTRFITHFCAPTFVFLSGTSAFLSLKNQSDVGKAQRFLLTRGLWLVILEYTIVNLGIWFDIHFGIILSQVIAVIGYCFIILALLIKLSPKIIGIIGLVIVFGHNLVDGFPATIENPTLKFIASYLLAPNFFSFSKDFIFLINYPIIPWLGIMLIGFASGQIFELSLERRKSLLMKIGLGALLLFVILRFLDVYGDSAKWTIQKNQVFTFLSFINLTKYPPSLFYSLVTLGTMLILLSWIDGKKSILIDKISVYGKVPLFYYLIHWYVIHITMIVMLLIQGFSWAELNFSPFNFGRPKGVSGVELPIIYLIWLGIVLLMYPLCQWYSTYKMNHKENKWLRYL